MKEVFTKLDLAVHCILSLIVSFVCIRFVVSESIPLNYSAIAISFICSSITTISFDFGT